MRSDSKLVWVRLNFRVNDLEFEDALMWPCEEDPADFQLVVEHRFFGLFALHEDFVLEVRETDGSATWRRVKLEELQFVFLEASQKVGATYTEDERARRRWLVVTPSGRETTNKHLARIPVEGDAGHIERAKEALSCGGVRYQIVGGIGSRGHIWGHATFQVCPLSRATIQLRNAGFLQSSNSKYVLFDSKNGWSIRLIEKAARTDHQN